LNNNELIDNIDKYNEDEYLQKVEEFLQGKGSMEDGKASERIVEFMDSLR
jgi:CDP-glycerol glycerophosphotransferase (TagB/SpsB family)